jgi:glutamyl-tRNA synthetase
VQDDDPRLPAAVALVMPRASTLIEVAEAVDYFFRDAPELDQAAAQKLLTPAIADKLAALREQLAAAPEPFERTALDARIKGWLEQSGTALQDIAQPARVALTGRKASPGLFEVIEVLGRERSLARLDAGVERARSGR